MHITVEAPSRLGASSTYPGGIQRLETSGMKEQEESKEEQNQELVQTKLTVGAPGDKYEQEADSMAGKVMAMPDSAVERPIQRQAQEEQEQLQMQPLEEIHAKSSEGEAVKFAKKIGNKLGFGKDKKEENKEKDKVKIPDGPVGEPVTFNARDEGHRLWIELKGGEPVVMVASTPEQAEVKLNNIVGEIQGVPNLPPHLLAKARELLRRGYGLLNVTEKQIDQRLDALRTNDNNVNMDNIRAEIDRRANSVLQKFELAHIFQELFEMLYNAKHTPEKRNPDDAVQWYHSQMQEAMGVMIKKASL
jgi:hypothetical protein